MHVDDLQDLVIARIAALTPSYQKDSTDIFRHDDDDQSGGQAPSPRGAFQLIQGQLGPSRSFTPASVVTTFELRFPYEDVPGIRKVVGRDGEIIMASIEGIGAALHADVTGCIRVGDWIPKRESAGRILCTIDFDIQYTRS